MYRIILGRSVKIGSIFAVFDSQDVTTGETATEKATVAVTNETGNERLIRMFQTDEFDTLSPELNSIMQVGFMSIFVGAIYGGVMSSKTAYIDFMKNNQATAFRDHLEAKKKLQDKVTISFGKGAFRWAWRLSAFCTCYMTVSTSISVYRGKYGIIEHMAAGTLSGLAYKFTMGPRGWIVGSGLGLVLGTMAGCVTYGLFSLTGVSMEEVRYWQYKWQQNRELAFNKNIQDQMEKDELIIRHKEKVGENKGLENIPLLEEKK